MNFNILFLLDFLGFLIDLSLIFCFIILFLCLRLYKICKRNENLHNQK